MNQEPEQSNSNGGNRGVNLVLGIFFTIGWIAGLCFFGVFLFLGDVMTEGLPAGSFIFQLIGLVSLAIAGILGGAAFYRPVHRRRLLSLFGWFLLAGFLAFVLWVLIGLVYQP